MQSRLFVDIAPPPASNHHVATAEPFGASWRVPRTVRQSSTSNLFRFQPSHLPEHLFRPVVLSKERHIFRLLLQIAAQKSDAVGIDNLISRLGRRVLERRV